MKVREFAPSVPIIQSKPDPGPALGGTVWRLAIRQIIKLKPTGYAINAVDWGLGALDKLAFYSAFPSSGQE